MADYLIHACNRRMWYVENFLIPSMKEQGIENISVYLDKNEEGCLKSFIESAKTLPAKGGVWHLQDDVVICRNFKELTEEYDKGLVCAFTCRYDDNPNPGINLVKDNMWWSFPCMRIPNVIIHNFHKWADAHIWTEDKYRRYVEAKKFDDYVFKMFLEENYPNTPLLNLAPNLVDHIDYLIGGSIINTRRGMSNVRSMYWEDETVIEELKQKIVDYVRAHKKY